MCAQGAQRLPRIHGRSPRFVFLTICTWDRRAVLTPARFGVIAHERLLRCAIDLGVDICAYTVMPDHVHVLARVAEGATFGFVQRWKQTTGYEWRRCGNTHPLWQRGFYDRILRLDEDPRRVAAYILMNPVRAGMVARPED